MDLKLFLAKDGQLTDISKISGDYQRSDNSEGLGEEFNFTLALNKKDKNWPDLQINLGEKVIFLNEGNAVFTGMLVEDECTNDSIHSLKCYDFGFLMNKNSVFVQFRKMDASTAIRKICTDYNIPVGSICEIPTLIDKVYHGDTISDCFKDILSQASADSGEKYRMEIRRGFFYVEKEKDLLITASFKGAKNIAPFDVTTEIADLKVTRSIADLKNSVKIISAGEHEEQVIGEASDSNSVAMFGLMEHVESLTGDDESKATNEAQNRLKELNKVGGSTTVRLMGDDSVRSGRLLKFAEKEISGTYKITNCVHHYSNNNHTMDLTLEVQ